MDSFFEILKSILQGIVQGITEWLPISSTGHIILLNEFLPFAISPDPERNKAFFEVFKVLVQLGSIMAVLVLFFHKLNPFSRKKSPLERRGTFSLWGKVLIASIPAAAIGFFFRKQINAYSIPPVIAGALIIYCILFIWMESRHKEPRIHNFKELDYKTVLLIGVFQMLALIPGTSRSGSTILGAVLLGTSRYVAAEFSFFMAIPVMVGASALEIFDFIYIDKMIFSGLEWTVLLVGMIVAFFVSLMVIRFLMNFIKKHSFKPFGYYRIALGVVIIVLLLAGVMQNTPTG